MTKQHRFDISGEPRPRSTGRGGAMRASGSTALISLALCVVSSMAPTAQAQAGTPDETRPGTPQPHPYVGMWVTGDGRIRHELLPGGRYDEARDNRRSAYRGRYEVTGDRIEYWDDTGFTADGRFIGPDVLHHGGMIFHRER